VLALAGLVVIDGTDRATRLTILDVGQGDAALLETSGGGRLLVDGGPDPDRLLVELDARIPPWDRRIDIVVLTHPHEDHAAGLARVLDRYRVGRVLEPGMRGPGPGWLAWDERLRAAGLPRATVATGGRFRIDEVALTVLWPDAGTVPELPPDSGRALNDVSIVLLGEAHGHRFLLTGDIEDDVDPRLLERGLPRVDILKVAHHGSATATTGPFVAALRPRVAVVSSGARNRYGHPAPGTLARLEEAGARVFRTDRHGSVELDLAPGSIGVRATGARTAASMRPGPLLADAAGWTSDALAAIGPWDRASAWANAFTCGIPTTRERARVGDNGAEPSPTPPAGTRQRGWPGPQPASWAAPAGYDPGDDRPVPSRSRTAALLPPAAGLADPSLVRGGRRGRLARASRGGPGAGPGCDARRDRRAPSRRGQGPAPCRSCRAPPARRGIGSMA
jgi:beta-lactamase superfamily II metal-dependent hydrolase